MLPSHLWRIASIFNQIINLLPPLPHGEHSFTAFDEIVRFHPWWWRYKLKRYGFKCNGVFSRGYFYDEPRMFSLNDSTIWLRGALAKLCGPSAYLYFFLHPKNFDLGFTKASKFMILASVYWFQL